mgnify:CR=1 FL=1
MDIRRHKFLFSGCQKEISAGIFCALIIAKAALPFIVAQHIHRLHGGSTHIFHVYIFHVAIHSQFNPYFYFITYLQDIPIIDWCQFGTTVTIFSTNSFFTSFNGVEDVVILSRSSKYCQ